MRIRASTASSLPLGDARRVEASEDAGRIALPEVGPDPLQELDEPRVGAELGPEPGNDAMVVCPERTRVARACPWAPGRIVQLADACFHGRSVAAGNRAAIRDRAALQCGELPRVVQSSDASAARPRELDVDFACSRLVDETGRGL